MRSSCFVAAFALADAFAPAPLLAPRSAPVCRAPVADVQMLNLFGNNGVHRARTQPWTPKIDPSRDPIVLPVKLLFVFKP